MSMEAVKIAVGVAGTAVALWMLIVVIFSLGV
jgi:hypothetical protein